MVSHHTIIACCRRSIIYCHYYRTETTDIVHQVRLVRCGLKVRGGACAKLNTSNDEVNIMENREVECLIIVVERDDERRQGKFKAEHCSVLGRKWPLAIFYYPPLAYDNTFISA